MESISICLLFSENSVFAEILRYNSNIALEKSFPIVKGISSDILAKVQVNNYFSPCKSFLQF